MTAIQIPLVLTCEEFGYLLRYNLKVVQRKCRDGRIKARGKPYRIPVSELEKFGVDPFQAAERLAARS